MKKVLVKFDEDAFEEYCELQNKVAENKKSRVNPSYVQLLSSINNSIKNLKLDPYFGNLIPRKYLTKKVISKYGTDKIFRVELVGYWRLMYTVIGEETQIIAFILEYVDHSEYNKLFNYKKR